MKLEIEEGKTYRTQLGRTVGPMVKKGDFWWDKSSKENSLWFSGEREAYNTTTGDVLIEPVHGKHKAKVEDF